MKRSTFIKLVVLGLSLVSLSGCVNQLYDYHEPGYEFVSYTAILYAPKATFNAEATAKFTLVSITAVQTETISQTTLLFDVAFDPTYDENGSPWHSDIKYDPYVIFYSDGLIDVISEEENGRASEKIEDWRFGLHLGYGAEPFQVSFLYENRNISKISIQSKLIRDERGYIIGGLFSALFYLQIYWLP